MTSVMRKYCCARLGAPTYVSVVLVCPAEFTSARVSPRADNCPLYPPMTNRRWPPRGPVVRARNAFTSGETYSLVAAGMTVPGGNGKSTAPLSRHPVISTATLFVLFNSMYSCAWLAEAGLNSTALIGTKRLLGCDVGIVLGVTDARYVRRPGR